MIRKIIDKWQQRYQKLYANKLWHLILDFGAILLIVLLIIMWWIIRGSQWEINQKIVESFKPIKHQPIVYQEQPLSWKMSFEHPVIEGSETELEAKIEYSNQAKQPILVEYNCRSVDDGVTVNFASSSQPLTIKNGGLSGQIEAEASSSLSAILHWQEQSSRKENKVLCQLTTAIGQQTWREAEVEFVFKKAGLVKSSAKAFYYTEDGDQVGIGPLPPMVGLPTSYLVTWTIDNNGGDLSDIQFSAVLGDEATWQGEAGLTGGNLSYDDKNRKINWRIADWSDEAPRKQASFYVSINPNKEAVGKVLQLVRIGQWKADDAWAEKKWQGQLPELTTNLDYDSRYKGQGTVQDWLSGE